MIPLPDSFADDSAQAEVADNRIYDQRDHADEPDDTGKIGPYIQGIDAAYRRSGKCLSHHRIYSVVDDSDTAVDGRMGDKLYHIRANGFGAGDQAQCALNGKRAKQANSNQCPQNTVDPLRCPFQHDSKHNDRQNQPAGGNAHIEQLQK